MPFSWSTATGTGSPPFRTGAHAWVTYAFAMHALTTGATEHHEVLRGLSRWILTMLDPAAGKRCFMGGQQPDVTWCSTEHTIDVYFALHLAGWVLDDAELMAGADVAEAALVGDLWNTGKGSFNQGEKESGTPSCPGGTS